MFNSWNLFSSGRWLFLVADEMVTIFYLPPPQRTINRHYLLNLVAGGSNFFIFINNVYG